MFIVGKSFFSEILSKFNIKTIAPLCIIQIPTPKLLRRQTLDLLYKLTVMSVVDHALPVYYNTLQLTTLARLD